MANAHAPAYDMQTVRVKELERVLAWGSSEFFPGRLGASPGVERNPLRSFKSNLETHHLIQ